MSCHKQKNPNREGRVADKYWKRSPNSSRHRHDEQGDEETNRN
jgi:hypothetical protein